MATSIFFCATFKQLFYNLVEKFKRAEDDLKAAIRAMPLNSREGDRMPSVGSFELRKIRLPLKAYNFSKRRGLRHINLIRSGAVEILYPVTIYKKGEIKNEDQVIAQVRIAVKNTLADIANKNYTENL